MVIDPPVLYPGTPVVLLSSVNRDGSTNLAPMSSAWALGRTAVLGLGEEGPTFANLLARPDCVLNYASADLWQAVERLAPLTGGRPRGPFRAERDKFGAAGSPRCRARSCGRPGWRSARSRWRRPCATRVPSRRATAPWWR